MLKTQMCNALLVSKGEQIQRFLTILLRWANLTTFIAILWFCFFLCRCVAKGLPKSVKIFYDLAVYADKQMHTY